MNEKVSVIIPTFNEENYIGKCLSSLDRQDYDKKFETIVVDYRSTDKTREIARKYDARIIDSPRKNVGFQRNLGAKESNGEICFYLDADSMAPKNWISRIKEEYENDRRTVMAGTLFSVKTDNMLSRFYYPPWYLALKSLSKLTVPMIPGCSTSVSKDALYRIGGFSEGTYEDIQLGLKARKVGKVKLIDDISVLTSGRGWERKNGKFKILLCNPVYAFSQGKINLREITKCK